MCGRRVKSELFSPGLQKVVERGGQKMKGVGNRGGREGRWEERKRGKGAGGGGKGEGTGEEERGGGSKVRGGRGRKEGGRGRERGRKVRGGRGREEGGKGEGRGKEGRGKGKECLVSPMIGHFKDPVVRLLGISLPSLSTHQQWPAFPPHCTSSNEPSCLQRATARPKKYMRGALI